MHVATFGSVCCSDKRSVLPFEVQVCNHIMVIWRSGIYQKHYFREGGDAAVKEEDEKPADGTSAEEGQAETPTVDGEPAKEGEIYIESSN